MIIMTVTFILSLGALWNIIMGAEVRHEGWVIGFQLLVFICGALLFYFAYRTSDTGQKEAEISKAFESGKAEILKELEKRDREENKDLKTGQEDIDKTVTQIFSGIRKTWDAKTGNKILASLAKRMEFVQGIIYLKENDGDVFKPAGEYDLTGQTRAPFRTGEGFAGQAAESKSPIILYDIPEQYFNIVSGLGSSKPRFLILSPLLHENECFGVLELAAFNKPDENSGIILHKVSDELGDMIHAHFAA